MKPLEMVYWLRFALGFVASLVCVGYVIAAFGMPFPTEGVSTIFLNGMALAIILYLISYYALKAKFQLQVQKTQKIFTTGIGIYFLSWIVFFALLYTAFVNV